MNNNNVLKDSSFHNSDIGLNKAIFLLNNDVMAIIPDIDDMPQRYYKSIIDTIHDMGYSMNNVIVRFYAS